MKEDIFLLADQDVSFTDIDLPCHIEKNDRYLAVTFNLQPLFAVDRSIYWKNLTKHISQNLDTELQDLKNTRKHELWKTTCLEIFICPTDTSRNDYIEINVAPCGNWNVYYFNEYRIPQPPRQAAIKTDFFSVKEPNLSHYGRQITLDLERLKNFFSKQVVSNKDIVKWKINITAVVNSAHDNSTFFAMHHATPADFHNKDYWYTI